MASVIALANEARAMSGKAPLGDLGPHICALGMPMHPATPALTATQRASFRDIVPQTVRRALSFLNQENPRELRRPVTIM